MCICISLRNCKTRKVFVFFVLLQMWDPYVSSCILSLPKWAQMGTETWTRSTSLDYNRKHRPRVLEQNNQGDKKDKDSIIISIERDQIYHEKKRTNKREEHNMNTLHTILYTWFMRLTWSHPSMEDPCKYSQATAGEDDSVWCAIKPCRRHCDGNHWCLFTALTWFGGGFDVGYSTITPTWAALYQYRWTY